MTELMLFASTFVIAQTRGYTRIYHGLSKHPLYITWKQMVARCYIPSTSHFQHYGGRGVRVAARWMDFRNFLADMGPSHSSGTSIDRINSNGHYAPDNCRWANKQTQSENRRGIRFIEIDGKRMLLASTARSNGLHPETVALRIKHGEIPSDAITRKAATSPKPRPVYVGGHTYQSLSAAAGALGVSRNAIFGRLKRGTARYLDE